jgi:hypothetical protein
MAGMFWPLCIQGTDTEESGVRGEGGRGDAAAQTERKLAQKKLSCLFTDCRPQGHLKTFCLNQKM